MNTFVDVKQDITRHLFSLAQKEIRPARAFWWKQKVMLWLMGNQELRTRVLRLVDVSPALKTVKEKNRHFKEYLMDEPVASRAVVALKAFSILPLAAVWHAFLMDRALRAMANHFMADSSARGVRKTLFCLRRRGAEYTFDILGEAVVSELEAEEYKEKYLNLIRALAKLGRPVDISLKLSSLYSQFDPIAPAKTAGMVKDRLREILRMVRDKDGRVTIDMEQYYFRDITWRIFSEILQEPEFQDFAGAGIAHQAYLRDSTETLERICDFAKKRNRPVLVRIVKGAYWDYELITARQKNWPIPVYTQRQETDLSFERQVDIALENYPSVKTAIGSHNIASIAYAMARHKDLGLPKDALEIQVLKGLGDPLIRPVLAMGYPLRVYVGLGDLAQGMSFLARRLLENTSQMSSAFFARQ